MKRLSLIVLSGIAAVALAACSHNPPPVTTPQQPNADSVAAAERARQDSIDRAAAEARAREETERQRQQRIADSLAALGHTTEAVRTMLATLIHFDYGKSNMRREVRSFTGRKVGITQS